MLSAAAGSWAKGCARVLLMRTHQRIKIIEDRCVYIKFSGVNRENVFHQKGLTEALGMELCFAGFKKIFPQE